MTDTRPPAALRVLCAGDLFIRADALAEAASRLGGNVRTSTWESRWPDEPFRSVDGVHEAAGDPAALAEAAADATVLLTHLAPVTAQVIDAAADLRVIGVTRGGPVNVDLPAATARGIPVVYLPGRNLEAVAEYVIGVVIALTRNIAAGARDLSAGRWDAQWYRFERTGPQLRTATVGLVGLGAIGSRVATLLSAFGTTVLAADPYADAAAAEAAGARLVPLAELLASSDVISLHARLTDDTRAMIDADALAHCRPGAYLVNTARGELVDEAALLHALEEGRLRGAALDVFHPEPPAPDHPLLARPDVLPTPHLAGASREVALESIDRVTREVGDFLRGEPIAHCANPDWAGRR
jgi:D-3-phosphoglycerate dehydrogenase